MNNTDLILKDIPLDQIDSNDENENIFDVSNVEHLADIIKEEGFTTPIEVIEKSDGRYEIISGHRRYAAMKYLGADSIPCCISKGDEDSVLTYKKLLSSNIATRKLSPLEIAKAIKLYKELLKKEGYKGNVRNKVAEYFIISPSNVYRYECLLKLIPELQELCKNPTFQYSSLREAASLSVEDQKKLYEEILEFERIERGEDFDEAIDINEICFTRTRIEQLINNKIRRKDKVEKTDEVKIDKEEPEFMNVPVETDIVEEDDVVEIIQDEPEQIIDLDDNIENIPDNSDSYLRGFETCITTIKAYKNSSYSDSKKSKLKEKINELRAELDKLEKQL